MSVVGFIFAAMCPAGQTANQAQEEGAAGGAASESSTGGGTDGRQISSGGYRLHPLKTNYVSGRCVLFRGWNFFKRKQHSLVCSR